jgi:hypothetical protein
MSERKQQEIYCYWGTVERMDRDNEQTLQILNIPPDVEQFGKAFFLQQMWCWGQDIRREEGNILLQYGFTRERPPEGFEGSSCYLLRTNENRNLILWGFGISYLQTGVGGIFLRRGNFVPLLTPTSDVPSHIWHVDQLQGTFLPRTAQEGCIACTLFSNALSWISDYEHWIGSTFGCEYRRSCLEKKKEYFLSAEHIAGEWERLSGLCSSFLARGIDGVGQPLLM